VPDMRLPLVILQGSDSEAAAQAYPGYTIILNQAGEQPVPVRLAAGCVCCSGRSELRDTLNRLYIDWAHDRERIKGAVLLVPPEAVLSDLEEFLTEDAILAARWALKPL
jgi:hypothetical protein